MPYTLNGIGTRYVGRSNPSVMNGVCPFCNRFVRLSHYDTRECFVVVFVPVIPLRKFRIQNDCSVCRKHYRVPWKEFQASVAATVNPLREAAGRAPRDEAAQAALVEGLVSLRLMKEAEEACVAALAALPEAPRLNELMGGLLAGRGDHAAALPFRKKSAALTPKSHAARVALGRSLVVLGQHQEAVSELQEARRLDPADAGTLRLLGDALYALGRHPEALQVYEDLLSRHPEAKERELLRNMAKCKEGLGYPLSPEEKKAGRRWWPFGGKAKPLGPAMHGTGTNWKRIGIVMGVLAGLVTAATLSIAFWRATHVSLYLDNGLKSPVTVTVDGTLERRLDGPVAEIQIPPGRHRFAARGKSGPIESFDATVEKRPFWAALFEPRFYVYNVSAAHIYRRARVTYSKTPIQGSGGYSETLVAFERFFWQRTADYEFKDAPQKIEMSSHSSSETRESFNVATDLDYDGLGVQRYREGKPDEAEKALRKGIALAPCESGARTNLVELFEVTNREEESMKEVAAWLKACPTRLEPHRVYQNKLLVMGQREALVGQYRAMVGAQPQSGAAHYLYGRLLDDLEGTTRELEEAVRLEPGLTWAQLALGNARLGAEKYPEAMSAFEAAMGTPDVDGSAFTGYAIAAIGAGSGEKATRVLRERVRKHGDDGYLWEARWNLLLAAKSWDAAARALDEREKADGKHPVLFGKRVRLLRLSGKDEQAEKALAAGCGGGKGAPKGFARACARLAFNGAFESGRFGDAAGLLAKDTGGEEDDEAEPMRDVYFVAALMLGNDRPGAEASGRALLAKLHDRQNPDAAAIEPYVNALLKKGDGAALLKFARRQDFDHLKHAYFVLGVRAKADGNAAAAREWFQKSEATALDSDFPLLAARRLAKG